jgi:hypothetical protein
LPAHAAVRDFRRFTREAYENAGGEGATPENGRVHLSGGEDKVTQPGTRRTGLVVLATAVSPHNRS